MNSAAGAALARLDAATAGSAHVRLHRVTGHARFATFPAGTLRLTVPNGAGPEQLALAFFAAHGDAFGVAPDELTLAVRRSDPQGGTHLSYRQSHSGVPVFGALLRVHFDARGNLVGVNGTTAPAPKLGVRPRIALADAIARAAAWVSRDPLREPVRAVPAADLAAQETELAVFHDGLVRGVPGTSRLVWSLVIGDAAGLVRERVFVDAIDGTVRDRIQLIHTALGRRVYEVNTTPGNLLWEEGDTIPYAGTEAAAVNDLIGGAEDAYNMYLSVSNGVHASWDGLDAVMDGVVNDETIDCPNAHWTGSFIGFCPGLTADDVVAHEWGHGFTDATHDLIYQWQPGALNESYSDIWGESTDLLNGVGTDTLAVRWEMGEDATGGSLRDMENPGVFGDPDRVGSPIYHCTASDDGGVHFNSGVSNRNFSLLVDGGTFNGQTVTGIGLDRALAIYWRAEHVYQVPTTDFTDHADALEQSCQDLLGVTIYTPSPDSATPAASADTILASHCTELSEAILATQLRTTPTQCDFDPLFDPNPPALCNGATFDEAYFNDFESALEGGWVLDRRNVANVATFDTPDWAIVPLPDDEAGSALFAENVAVGDCAADDETGVVYAQTPPIVLPANGPPTLSFDHLVGIEDSWDGGNVKISVNGGTFVQVPTAAFTFNPYNRVLEITGNTNPNAGQPAFSGGDEGSPLSSWGQSQVNLSTLAAPGDSIRLRFELGVDACNGVAGWWVDDLRVGSCPICGNGVLDAGEECDDENGDALDGCSATCEVETGFTCSVPAGFANVVADPGFEGGITNPDWTSTSTNFGTTLCTLDDCGGVGPADGTIWSWFGGTAAAETGTLSQDVIIPEAPAATLTLDLWRSACNSSTHELEVLLDGNDVHSFPCVTDAEYLEQTVDVTAYADGLTHTLMLRSIKPATGTTNIHVDNVQLFSSAPPSVCSDEMPFIEGFELGHTVPWSATVGLAP